MAGRGKPSSLLNYIVLRLLLTLPMLFILLTLVFVLLRVAPGDPAAAMLGAHASVEVIDELRERMGLNRPLVVQYFDFIGDTLRGDLGKSFRFEVPVWDLVKHRLTATLELVFFAFLIAVVIGLAVGIFSANRRGTVWDLGGNVYGILTYAFPIFWLGIMCQLFFAVKLGWLPTSGRFTGFLSPPAMHTGLYVVDSLIEGRFDKLVTSLRYLALPASVLGVYISGIFARMVRTNMLQTLKSDYVQAARARGVKERWVSLRHGLKNALVPVVTVLGLQFALLLGGAVLTETTFSWPGLGSFLVGRLLERDYPAVQGIVTVFALGVVIMSIVIDIVNALIDPRIRY
ncbi:MAG: ABC transporter permease [Bacillota bacterium]|nr:MAG: ABC transporter permease [Bacillota bacterium]